MTNRLFHMSRRLLVGAAGAAAFNVVYQPPAQAAWGHVFGGGSKTGAPTGAQGVVQQAIHLRNTAHRFRHYADSLCEMDGSALMSPRAFVLSVIGADKHDNVRPSACADVAALFHTWEPSSGGRIGQDTYALLTLLLTTSRKDLRRMFELYDANESSTLTSRQFIAMLAGVAASYDRTAKVDLSGGAQKHLFGGGDKELASEFFESSVGEVRRAVWRAGFQHYDSAGTGGVSAPHFMRMALASAGVVGRAADSRIERAMKSTESLHLQEQYQYDSWVALQMVAQHQKEIMRMSSMARKKFPLDPTGWYNLCRSSQVAISRQNSDLIYFLLDRHGDRALELADVASGLALFGRKI
eukprot:TRINITY_DN7818_c0_g1_i1.p1 TRINITY_DN7818_c0_g1~~TRINITY_DN7818_c0_g1_i1.p1  ORF type:complete len:354 (+),score=114.83 TRINITY_DN7818_c0_g1_i1:73-1134(+)